MRLSIGTSILASTGMAVMLAVTAACSRAPDDRVPTLQPPHAGEPSAVVTLPPFPKWPASRDANAAPADLVSDWMQGIGNPSRTAAEQEDAFARMFYGGQAVKAHLDDFLPRARITAEAGAGFARLQQLWAMTPGYASYSGYPEAASFFLVTSAKKDDKALGGFADCLTNQPSLIPGSLRGQIAPNPPGGISILVYPDTKTQRLNVAITNTGREGVWLRAADSHPIIRPEYWDSATGGWLAWTGGPQVTCGNSYHRVYLPAGEHWIAGSLAYTRPTATRERLVLESGDESWISNEYVMPPALGVPVLTDGGSSPPTPGEPGASRHFGGS